MILIKVNNSNSKFLINNHNKIKNKDKFCLSIYNPPLKKEVNLELLRCKIFKVVKNKMLVNNQLNSSNIIILNNIKINNISNK